MQGKIRSKASITYLSVSLSLSPSPSLWFFRFPLLRLFGGKNFGKSKSSKPPLSAHSVPLLARASGSAPAPRPSLASGAGGTEIAPAFSGRGTAFSGFPVLVVLYSFRPPSTAILAIRARVGSVSSFRKILRTQPIQHLFLKSGNGGDCFSSIFSKVEVAYHTGEFYLV